MRKLKFSKANYSSSSSEKDQQCQGLSCINAARRGSKYCCQECCMQLAKTRIQMFMPQQLASFHNLPSIAEHRNKQQLKALWEKIDIAKTTAFRTEYQRIELEKYIIGVEKIKRYFPILQDENSNSENFDNLMMGENLEMDCVICGYENISYKSYTKHLVRCFVKYELKRELWSPTPPAKLSGSNLQIFCDHKNRRDGTYCKRMYAICPKHSKIPEAENTQICGYRQLPGSLPDFGPEIMCEVQKKRCCKHFGWERNQRADLDVQRLLCWVKVDELISEERKIRKQLESRGDVMSVLLNKTTRESNDLPPELEKILQDRNS